MISYVLRHSMYNPTFFRPSAISGDTRFGAYLDHCLPPKKIERQRIWGDKNTTKLRFNPPDFGEVELYLQMLQSSPIWRLKGKAIREGRTIDHAFCLVQDTLN